MKQKFFLSISLIFLAMITYGGTSAYRRAAQQDAQFSQYDLKRSRLFCSTTRPSTCSNPAGFQKYKAKGCINDIDGESKCLVAFCSTNCAALTGCPTDGALQEMCRENCLKVNLRNEAAQNRLNECVQGSYNADQAAAKEGRRDFYRAQQKDLSRGQKAARKEAQVVLDLVKKLSEKRKALFYVDSAFSNGGIVRIDDFTKKVKEAIELTVKMNNAVYNLERSRQASDIVDQARGLIAASEKHVTFFINIVNQLSQSAMELRKATAQSSTSSVSRGPSGYASGASSRPVSTADSAWDETAQSDESEERTAGEE